MLGCRLEALYRGTVLGLRVPHVLRIFTLKNDGELLIDNGLHDSCFKVLDGLEVCRHRLNH
jgi:hypothetical protein